MFTKVQYKLTFWFIIFSLIPSIILYFWSGVIVIIGTLVCLIILAFFVARMFTQPISFALSNLAKLAQGELDYPLPENTVRDERGHIILKCREITTYMKAIAEVMLAISQGELQREFSKYPQTGELGQACAKLVSYIQNLSKLVKSIEAGNISTQIVPVSDQDVLGQGLRKIEKSRQHVASHYTKTVEEILLICQNVVLCANTEIQNVEKLLNSTEGTSSSMTEMQASVEEIGMNIEALTASIESTTSSISEMGSSISQVTRNSEKLSEFVEKTSAIIAQAVAAMEKVADNAENSKILSSDTMRDASKGQDAMKKMSESVQTISETVASASDVIQQLEARSDEIGSVLDVIDDIADQTQLLALNASIIAAQAGEHGRGFAVVAAEIKELANRVTESTKEISRIVKTVQEDSAKAVQAMKKGNVQVKEGLKLARLAGDALEKIILGAQWSANVANEIANAIQEQTQINQSIKESIQDVVHVATENTRATKEQEIGASRVTEAVAKMSTLADQVHRATVAQTTGSAEVINATEEMSALVHESVNNTRQLLDATNVLVRKAELLAEIIKSY